MRSRKFPMSGVWLFLGLIDLALMRARPTGTASGTLSAADAARRGVALASSEPGCVDSTATADKAESATCVGSAGATDGDEAAGLRRRIIIGVLRPDSDGGAGPAQWRTGSGFWIPGDDSSLESVRPASMANLERREGYRFRSGADALGTSALSSGSFGLPPDVYFLRGDAEASSSSARFDRLDQLVARGSAVAISLGGRPRRRGGGASEADVSPLAARDRPLTLWDT